jgi:hypothetical protein
MEHKELIAKHLWSCVFAFYAKLKRRLNGAHSDALISAALVSKRVGGERQFAATGLGIKGKLLFHA